MTTTEIITWIENSFKPLQLTLPNETLRQIVENSIIYWNTHSAYKIAKMFPYTSDCIQLSPDIKTVVNAYPSTLEQVLFQNHPMWVLLGFITLDRYTQDLMLLSHTFDGYRIYLGNDFRWKWVRSTDSTKGGYLYLQQVPPKVTSIAVIGTKRILPNEDIKDEFVYQWIREHARATVKMYEGNVLRKADIIGVHNDGQALVDEGKAEREVLEEKLRQEGRWILTAIRR